jgi:hypothetical protein
MKAHIQQENEELSLNKDQQTDVTNNDYDEIVQLPSNNQPRFVYFISNFTNTKLIFQ